MTERFDAHWLALREPIDYAARSLALAQRLAARLPRRPHLLDLGAGTGGMFRFLAPAVGRGQDWILLDADAALLDDAFGRTAAWARRRGYAATAEGDTLLLSTPQGLWRMRALQHDLANGPLPASDAVVCSALLDLASASWLERLCTSLTVPFFACLTADGRDVWRPRHPFDPHIAGAFRRDMRRDKGFGPALGTAAAGIATRLLAACGFAVASAPSDWRVPRNALALQHALINGIAETTRRIHPQAAAVWQTARLRQAMRGRLAISIGHRDILALPPGG